MTAHVLDPAVARWLAEFADQGIFTTDEHLVVTSWNRWLERHTARPSAEIVGRPLFDAFPDLVPRGLDEPYREALAGHGYLLSHLLHGYLLPMPARGGQPVFANMPQRARIAPLLIESRIVGTITVIDDVSERVASDHELRRQIDAQHAARTAAEKALRVKDDFLATLSHEIRTPLNAVLGWARILIERELEPQLLARAVESIFRNATVQARMIDDLLDTARIMAGKLRLQMQPVDLVAVSIAALDVMAPSIEAKRIQLKKQLDPAIGPVAGDPDRLQQIIWNLLSNAAKFTDTGGTIELQLEQVPGRARIRVSDTGKGIGAEFLPLIFERFRQADTSSSRREGGLGLGLALVRELVELHGGTVRADSPGIGRGSSFVVELPTMRSHEQQGQSGNAAAVTAHDALAGTHVLLVEDEEDARTLLSAILHNAQARVTTVTSSREALGYLHGAGEPPDVIVSDIGMSPQDGYQLIAEVRRLPPDRGRNLAAVAVTAYASPMDRERALEVGYHDHVPKPVDPAVLIAAIVRAVRATRV
jgi:signal transduction histidine kinase/ActR/RegA family two-component response regulator